MKTVMQRNANCKHERTFRKAHDRLANSIRLRRMKLTRKVTYCQKCGELVITTKEADHAK